MNASPADTLADAIISRRLTRLEGLATSYPRKNSILSDVGDCERQMTYSVLDWDKRPLPDPELQARFEAGKEFERHVVRELIELGFDFQQGQMPVQITARDGSTIATGKIDGFIRWEGRRIPVEIKSMNPHIFDSITSIEDFQKKPWLRKYTRQLMMYMFGNNEEFGLFIVGDLLGHWRMLPLALDFGEAEMILQRLERVHKAIQSKTYPDRITYDQSICGKCPFTTFCLPDIINKPADLIENPQLEADIERREELKPLKKEYDALDDKIKETFTGIEKAVVGSRWLVMNVPSQRTTYEIPEDVKKQYAKKVPMTRFVIEDLNARVKDAA